MGDLYGSSDAAGDMPISDPLCRSLKVHSRKPSLIQHFPCLLPCSDREKAVQSFDYYDSVPGVYLDSGWIRVLDCMVKRGRDDRFVRRV